MTDNTAETTLLQELVELAPIKTWSLIATMFGDLDHEQIRGKQASSILEASGIKPEAMRVAFHRLRKEGWLVSAKSGREVIYSLSTEARAQTHAAYDRVYSQSTPFADGWEMVLSVEDFSPSDSNAATVNIAKNIFLRPVGSSSDKTGFVVERVNDGLPDWFEDRLVPPDARRIALSTATIAAQKPEGQHFRLLLLHRWRLLALRNQTWAHIDLFPDGPLAQCHEAVSEYLSDTPRLTAKQ